MTATAATATTAPHGFGLLWTGGLVNALGSGMTAFGVAAAVFGMTGDASAVSAVLACALAPPILLGPVAGVAADRHDRRLLMALGDGGGIVGIAVVAWALSAPAPAIPLVCVGMLLTGSFAGLSEPAFKASITDLVAPDDYARSAALVQLTAAARLLLAPVAAGVLLAVASVHAILAVDAATVVVTVACTLVVRRSAPSTPRGAADAGVLDDLREGARTLVGLRGVVALVGIFVLTTFAAGLAQVLFKPLMLPRISVTAQGVLESVAASGLLVGSAVVGRVVARRGSHGTLVAGLVGAGASLALLPHGRVGWVGTMGVVFFACLALVNTGADVLVRSSLPNETQGRAWGLIGLLSQLGFPIAYVVAGPLADRVFEPLLAPDGALAPTLGAIVGVGPGHGVAVIFSLAGVMVLVSAVAIGRSAAIAALEPTDDASPDLHHQPDQEVVPC